MEPFKIMDDFGSELTLFSGRLSGGYGIRSLYLVNPEIYREKEPKVLSPNVKFYLTVSADNAIHTLFYKGHKAALKAYSVLTEVASKKDEQ